MATDMNRLQGEVCEDLCVPALGDEVNSSVEKLLIAFLRTLVAEQKPACAPLPAEIPSTGNEIPNFLRVRKSVEKASDSASTTFAELIPLRESV